MKKTIAIETIEFCFYGCGKIAKFINGSGNYMCSASHNTCDANRKKNSENVKNCGRSYKDVYATLSDETKNRMNWAKGHTKETHPSIAKVAEQLKGRKTHSKPHTEETKKKISVHRTEWLKKQENRTNYGRYKKSWMEEHFEIWLINNNVVGWETEKHFWNSTERKNYFVDFLFENDKMIIELDGTQHRKTKELDLIRDKYFESIGFKVIRITQPEFKERYFSGFGFKDILPA